MGILTVASGKSVYRGYDYYKNKKVLQLQQTDDTVFDGIVLGNSGGVYHVTIDTAHPRKSVCDCPHAAGRKIVCKHMVALYFSAVPGEAENYIQELEAYWEEEEQRQEDLEENLIKYIKSLKKNELQDKLLELLYDCPEWLFDRFIRDNLDY